MSVGERAPDPTAPAKLAADGMVWIPGGTFLMGSDNHYPEEAPARQVAASGFWIDPSPVTNQQFSRFVRKTGYVTLAERPPDPADYPGARPEMITAFSAVFVAPRQRVSLADPHNRWIRRAGRRLAAPPGSRHIDPQQAGSSGRAHRVGRR